MTERTFVQRYKDHVGDKRGIVATGAIATFLFTEMIKAAIGFFTLQFLKNWWDKYQASKNKES